MDFYKNLTNQSPFIVAELSGNHNQSLDTAKALIDAAAEAGVDAIKLQTYRADTMTLDVDHPDFKIEQEDNLWQGEHLYNLYQQAATPYEWHQELFDYAQSNGLVAFSSPFDQGAVDLLTGLDVPCFKIASFELTDLPLIRHVATQGKPVIMSTGLASIEEIEQAIATVEAQGNNEIVLLKCTSTYPSDPENAHLNTITDMQKRFGYPVGLSDHSLGIGVAVASVALGVCMIEKHLVLDRNSDAVDAQFSMTPEEFKLLVSEVKQAHRAMGSVCYGGSDDEQESKKFRRSIYVKSEIKAGETFSDDNLQIIRPAYGLPPADWDKVLGKSAQTDLVTGTPLDWSHVQEES